MITAGPTREFIDPVRFISNPSSGKMGYALAGAASRAGHEVTLIAGPTALKEPEKIRFIRILSASDMLKMVIKELPSADILIMAAAVCDYRPASRAGKKMKKTAEALTLELVPTIDVLKKIGEKKQDKFVVGFAAETDNLIENARQKLEKKNLDMIIVNLVGVDDAGFESDTNKVTIIYPDGKIENLPAASKKIVAEEIIQKILVKIGKDT